jgi:hypothetical protein
MRRVGAGDKDVRISLTRKDEVGELFEAFNAMAASLQGGGSVENVQHNAADHEGRPPSHRITVIRELASLKQKYFQGYGIRKSWKLALSSTAGFFCSNIAAFREKTAAVTARFLQLIQQRIASRLEKLEAGRKASSAGKDASETEENAASLAPDIWDSGAAGEALQDKAPVQERKPEAIEQAVAAEASDLVSNRQAALARSDILICQQEDGEVDGARLQNKQKKSHEDFEGAVARAVAKHEASTTENATAERKVNHKNGGQRGAIANEDAKTSGKKNQPAQSCRAAESGLESEESAVLPGSGLSFKTSTSPDGFDVQNSTIVVGSLQSKHSKK